MRLQVEPAHPSSCRKHNVLGIRPVEDHEGNLQVDPLTTEQLHPKMELDYVIQLPIRKCWVMWIKDFGGDRGKS